MRKIAIYSTLMFGIFTFSQSKHVKGEIIDSLKVQSIANETFALYLPTTYNPNELSPIIFIYEPMGRGKVGIKPFIKGSEKYGYILICSNTSRNGPMENNFEIANRLFQHVFNEFNVDPKFIYTAGFSGGARLASSIAVLTKQITGVIACGAGFAANNQYLPTTPSFSYAAIVGDEDMNYNELLNTGVFLKKLNIPHEIFVYEMGHTWPSENQIEDALDWLQLEALRKKISKEENHLSMKILKKYEDKALEFETNGSFVNALKIYERILRNFPNVGYIKEKMKKLKSNKDLKKQQKEFEKSLEIEQELSKTFGQQFSIDMLNPTKSQEAWWRKEISLLKDLKSKSNAEEQKMYKRLLYSLYALAIETATIDNSRKINTNQLIFCYQICLTIYPKYYNLYFRQIANYIDIKDHNGALDTIEQLFKAGFTDKEKVKNYAAFKPITRLNRFKKLTQ